VVLFSKWQVQLFQCSGGFQGDFEIEFSILINLETIKTSQIYLFVLDISGIESPLCSPFEIKNTASIRLMRSKGDKLRTTSLLNIGAVPRPP
jgi:hypothetical protein